MLKRDEYLNVFLALYSISCLIYIGYTQDILVVLIPTVILVTFLLTKSMRGFFPLTLLASTFFIGLASNSGVYMSIPLSIFIPLTMRERSIDVENTQKTVFFGPSSLRIFSYLIPSSLLILIDLRILISISMLTIATLAYTIYGFSILSRVETKVIVPRSVVSIDEKLSVVLSVKSSAAVYIVVDYGIGKVVRRIREGDFIELELRPEHFGRHLIEINVYAIDSLLFSYRHIARHIIEYRVSPLTEKILNVIVNRLAEVPDILSRIPSAEVMVLEVKGEGAAIAIQGAKALATIRRYIAKTRGIYLETVLRRFEEVFEESAKETLYPRKSRYGEYVGSRQYIPGDNLRDIHWKKSVSRGMLIVKEFSFPTIELITGGEGLRQEPIVIADLYAPNAVEFDKIVYALLKTYLELFKKSPNINSLAIIVIGNIILGLKGRIIDILSQLYKVFKDLPIQMMFNYNPPIIDVKGFAEPVEASEKPKPLKIIVLSNERFAEHVLRLIVSNGFLPPKPFTTIHSPSLGFRYYIVSAKLIEYGFAYTDSIFIPKLVESEKSW